MDDVTRSPTDLPQGRLVAERRALQAARLSGSRASEVLDEVEAELDRAVGLGVLDLFGGGWLVTALKHGRLGGAKRYLDEAEQDLRDFADDLGRVREFAVPQIRMRDSLALFDHLFDGLFADALMQSRIDRTRRDVVALRDEVESLLAELDARCTSLDEKIAWLRT